MRFRYRPAALVLLVVLVAFAAVTARLFVWPSLPPLPARADAIIEIGGPGDRDAAARALALDHRAPRLVQSTLASDAVSDTCLPPVPDVTIGCFHAEPPTTRGEARWIGRTGAAEGWRSVIVVTSRDHAWRARLRVGRCFPGQVYVKTTPLPHWYSWLRQIPYQWTATIKAELFQRGC